jgi:hypothetical protein
MMNSYDLKLADFGEQAFQSNAPWVRLQTRESRPCSVIGEQGVQTVPGLGIEALGDRPKCPFVMGRTRRRDQRRVG